MTFADYTLTLTGSAQRLSTVVTGGVTEPNCFWIDIQPAAANAGAVFIGGSAAVTTSDYGTRLPVPVSTIPSAPYHVDGATTAQIKLSGIWVIGTDGDVIHVYAAVLDN